MKRLIALFLLCIGPFGIAALALLRMIWDTQ